MLGVNLSSAVCSVLVVPSAESMVPLQESATPCAPCQPKAGRQRKGNSTAARDLLLFYPHPIAPSNCVIAGSTSVIAPATRRTVSPSGIRAVLRKKSCHI
jgi:hypothetical protein